jgi:putative ABC transport system permease protein
MTTTDAHHREIPAGEGAPPGGTFGAAGAPEDAPGGPAPPPTPGRRLSPPGLLAAAVGAGALLALAAAVDAPPAVAAVVALLLAPVFHDLVGTPTFRRLAVRNATRRKGEAALVVLGSLLGTAIITASFVVGDTITSSLRDFARTRMGPVDQVVRVLDPAELAAVESVVVAALPPEADGTLRMLTAGAAIAGTDADRPRAEPAVTLTEVDFDAVRRFDGGSGIAGFDDAGATPQAGEAVINDRLARSLEVQAGDTVVVFAYGAETPLTVRTVVEEIGVAGYGSADSVGFGMAPQAPVFVSPGTVSTLAEASTVATAAPPEGQILVTNGGGVFGGADRTDAVVAALEAALADRAGVEVAAVKQDFLDAADENGASIEELYAGIGWFSVIAGVLLLVNLFVMLAEERKVELGMLRAVGFKRGHLARTFAFEGAAYAAAAAVLGALAGVGVGWVITRVASSIIAADDPDLGFRLAVEPSSLVAGGLLGLTISLVTVWFTSARISRLNVIAAIRDLPEPRNTGRRLTTLLLGVAGVALGGLLFVAGTANDDPFGTMAGVPVAAFSSIGLLSRLVRPKVVIVGASLVVIAWTVGVFTLFPAAMRGAEIAVFVVMGVLLVSAAVLIAGQVDHLWVAVNDRLSGFGGGLAARLGLAYPLARRFRTAMLLGMYAIIIFTLTFMSAFIAIFANQAPSFTRDLAAGYDVWMESNPANPVTVDQLLAQPEVTAAAPLLFGIAEFAVPGDVDGPWGLTGIDDGLLAEGYVALASRAERFDSDVAVWEALLADDSLVVVNDFFLQRGGGPPEQRVSSGEVVEVTDPVSGTTRRLEVAGVLGADFVFHGALVNRRVATDLLGPRAAARRHYVAVAPGLDAQEVADTLTGRLVANGAEATSFRAQVDDAMATNQSFFDLMRGYLGLGLLIGIAGLGVVMVRAVRERRREIGMLRAMGFSAGVVRRAFLVEAAFIAVQGALIGIGLGMLTAYMVVVHSTTFGDQRLPFEVPWAALGFILVVPLAASLLAAAAPASQAARIKPAVALRIAE